MWDENVYYSPEKFGLKIVGGLEEAGMSYEFHTLVVWEDEQGNLFMAEDYGCSCPAPFEDLNSVEELERIGSYDQFVRALDDFRRAPVDGGYASVDSLRRKVKRRLAKTEN